MDFANSFSGDNLCTASSSSVGKAGVGAGRAQETDRVLVIAQLRAPRDGWKTSIWIPHILLEEVGVQGCSREGVRRWREPPSAEARDVGVGGCVYGVGERARGAWWACTRGQMGILCTWGLVCANARVLEYTYDDTSGIFYSECSGNSHENGGNLVTDYRTLGLRKTV
ncbi:hypothetical protein FIBSPDRAFT_893167 [Athelia psychrophila]|uniref:Uncharacterized protein n=1 Tax=Athelia psychrophila TaxID=1759441 RepID=A0A166HKV0_9AGAM|nr:hypothetical protein FIBSPDRAFT_893167 [Fibularhizoctonia sp. CBS 109695]